MKKCLIVAVVVLAAAGLTYLVLVWAGVAGHEGSIHSCKTQFEECVSHCHRLQADGFGDVLPGDCSCADFREECEEMGYEAYREMRDAQMDRAVEDYRQRQ